MVWFLKYYRHHECHTSWTDEWSCACNDRCPQCNAEIEPYKWADLSVIVQDNGDGTWDVLVSPATAEDRPDYEATKFSSGKAAKRFAVRKRKWFRQNLWAPSGGMDASTAFAVE
jgi:hypothetical protein